MPLSEAAFRRPANAAALVGAIRSLTDGARPLRIVALRWSTSSCVTARLTVLEPGALAKRMMLAMRLTSTVVLPEPAPARISSGPSVAKTAWRCTGLSLAKQDSMYWSRRAMNSWVSASGMQRGSSVSQSLAVSAPRRKRNSLL